MTIEQNQPQPPAENVPQAQASNQPQGQFPGSGGHRRRRRRKRNKGGAGAQANGQPQQPQAQTQPSPPQPQAQKPKFKPQPPPSSQTRFFRNNDNRGNTNGNGNGNGGGGGRRRNKQRRERVFVGPMDHSYRAVNGNVADGPPSTIEYRNSNGNGNGNGNSHGHYQDYGPREAVPVMRDDAPTRIFLFIEDLFFFAKINETARKLGIKVAFVKNDAETLARILEAPEDARPSLIVFDLNNLAAKPMTLIPKLKSKLKRGTSIIGFLSHLQGDLKAKAVEAGCDIVMPRSAFSQNLPTLLRRHGLDEEEEVEFAEA
ncbi:MAG: response regulator [Acidobacteriaceae bacterium]